MCGGLRILPSCYALHPDPMTHALLSLIDRCAPVRGVHVFRRASPRTDIVPCTPSVLKIGGHPQAKARNGCQGQEIVRVRLLCAVRVWFFRC